MHRKYLLRGRKLQAECSASHESSGSGNPTCDGHSGNTRVHSTVSVLQFWLNTVIRETDFFNPIRLVGNYFVFLEHINIS